MSAVIKIMGTAFELFARPLYVKSVDHSKPPADSVVLTGRADEAKRFADKVEAFEAWRGINQVDPVRPDGKLNRPLSAYTVEITDA
jgi:hypothetical protein